MTIKCPKCDTDNPSDSKYCKECATPIPSQDVSVTKTLETSKEELTTGSTFAGRYQIIEELGKGGMGTVYKALDTEIKEKVALKLIKPEIAADKKTIERFRNELKFARKIRHKNVCQMYDLNRKEGTHYIMMEYIPGEDLKSFMKRSKQLSILTAVSLAKHVCEGLAEAHRLGVVHRDMKPQKDQDYFCEGLVEELINALTQVKDLKVAARSSSFSFKGKDVDIREIGRILNVGTVLEGSVQKSGNRLRITTQLINVSDGYHLWSERFDRTMDNIFAIQDEISMAVVDKLKGELLEEDKEKITKRHTANKDALNLYLKGRYFFNRRYQGDMIKAVDFYQRAIDKDPDYALPYVGIADVFNILGQWGFIRPIDAYTRSKAMLQKSMEIDSSLSISRCLAVFIAYLSG